MPLRRTRKMGVIPVPSPAERKNTPLWKMMGVKKNDPGLVQMTRHIRSLCHINLDMDLTYTNQPKDALKKIIDEAVRMFPELKKYANYWPVKEIVRTKLYDIKRYLGQKERRLRVAAYQAAACDPPSSSPSVIAQTSGIDGSSSLDTTMQFTKEIHAALPPQEETVASLCLPERWCDLVQILEVSTNTRVLSAGLNFVTEFTRTIGDPKLLAGYQGALIDSLFNPDAQRLDADMASFAVRLLADSPTSNLFGVWNKIAVFIFHRGCRQPQPHFLSWEILLVSLICVNDPLALSPHLYPILHALAETMRLPSHHDLMPEFVVQYWPGGIHSLHCECCVIGQDMINLSIRFACIKTFNIIFSTLADLVFSSQHASALVDVALHALSFPVGEGSEIRFLVFDTLLGIMTNCSITQAAEQRDRCMVLLQGLVCNEPVPSHKQSFYEQLRMVDFVQASPYDFILEGVDGLTVLESHPSH